VCSLAAKQEAFEESIRLKNQFRNLDEDEIEFLDSVLESTRAKEEALKKETAEQLNFFRRQQEEADRALLYQVDNAEGGTAAVGKAHDLGISESQWAINARKKRKRPEKEVLKGVKIRKGSSSVDTLLPSDILSHEAVHTPDKPEEPTEVPSSKDNNIVSDKTVSCPKDLDDQTKKHLLEMDNVLQPSLGLAAYSSDEE
jgi:hypothetical protein